MAGKTDRDNITVKITRKEYELLQKLKKELQEEGLQSVPEDIREEVEDEKRDMFALGALVGLGAAALLKLLLEHKE